MSLKYWSLKDIVEVIEGCIKNKFDFVLACEGKRGCGKSTLLYKIACRLGNRDVIYFNPEKCLVYSRDDTIKLLANQEKTVIFSDEMINVSYKRDFYEQQQKTLIKGLNMYRDSCNVFMMAVPLFKDLDGDMRQLSKMKISVIRRGVAYIYIQPNFHEIIDSQLAPKKKKYKYNVNLKLEPTKKIGILLFKDLRPKQREVYEEIKKRKRGQVYEGQEGMVVDPMDNWYKKLYDQVMTGNLSKESFSAICDMAGKKETSVRTRINMMLKDNREDSLNNHFKIKEVNKKVEKWD